MIDLPVQASGWWISVDIAARELRNTVPYVNLRDDIVPAVIDRYLRVIDQCDGAYDTCNDIRCNWAAGQ